MTTRILIVAVLTLLFCAGGAAVGQEKIDVYQQKKQVKSVVFQVGLNEYFVNNQTPGVRQAESGVAEEAGPVGVQGLRLCGAGRPQRLG